MASTRRSSLLSSPNPSLALHDSFEAFKRKHLSQNKEIIHKNSELTKANSELLVRITQLRNENLELKGTRFQLECELAGMRDRLDKSEARAASALRQAAPCGADPEHARALAQTVTDSISALQAVLRTLALPSVTDASPPSSPPSLEPTSLAEPASHLEQSTTNVSSRRRPHNPQPRASFAAARPDLSLISEGETAASEESDGPGASVSRSPSPPPLPPPPSPPRPPITAKGPRADGREDQRRPGRRVSGLLVRRREEQVDIGDEDEDDILGRIEARARERHAAAAPALASSAMLPPVHLSSIENIVEPEQPADISAPSEKEEEEEEDNLQHRKEWEREQDRLKLRERDRIERERAREERRRLERGKAREVLRDVSANDQPSSKYVATRPPKEKRRLEAQEPLVSTISLQENSAPPVSTMESVMEEPSETEGAAEGRRPRKSVNYALPKLNTKMRRPVDYVPTTKKAKPRNSSAAQVPSTLPSSQAPRSAPRTLPKWAEGDEDDEEEEREDSFPRQTALLRAADGVSGGGRRHTIVG